MRQLLLAALLVLPAAAAATVGQIVIRTSKGGGTPPPPPPAVGTVELSSVTAVAAPIIGIASDGTYLWVAESRTSGTTKIWKMDHNGAATGFTVGTGNLDLKSLAYDGTYMWAFGGGIAQIYRIDSAGTVVGKPTSGSNMFGGAYDGATLWTVDSSGNTLHKLNAGLGTDAATYTVGSQPTRVAYDGANMWTTNYAGGSVSKVTSGGTVTTYSLTHPANPKSIAYDGAGFMYVGGDFQTWVAKVDITNGTATYISITDGGLQVGGCFASGNYWTAEYNGATGFTDKVTPAGSVTSFATPNSYPSDCVFDGSHDIWISNPDGTVNKVRVN